jgi:hypothetical protein
MNQLTNNQLLRKIVGIPNSDTRMYTNNQLLQKWLESLQ